MLGTTAPATTPAIPSDAIFAAAMDVAQQQFPGRTAPTQIAKRAAEIAFAMIAEPAPKTVAASDHGVAHHARAVHRTVAAMP